MMATHTHIEQLNNNRYLFVRIRFDRFEYQNRIGTDDDDYHDVSDHHPKDFGVCVLIDPPLLELLKMVMIFIFIFENKIKNRILTHAYTHTHTHRIYELKTN